ncbi:MAG TPA: hypothetical protein VMU35_05495, partial [Methylomirabilota bacterium]|nr:hypothetical protein [Methylomirabilota bacterium]
MSTALAAIIMIAIMLAAAAALINWEGSGFGALFSGSQVHYQQQQQAEQERFDVEKVYYNAPQNQPVLRVFVRNDGPVEVNIVAIYVNGTMVTPSSPDPSCAVSGNQPNVT